MIFYNKVKWILGIAMVFVIIVTTNLIDRNNFLQVKDSIVTIYEDRLVANDLLFEMSKAIQDKEIAVSKSDLVFYLGTNKSVNKNIETSISKFEKTKLTLEEENLLKDFKKNIELLLNAEKNFVASKFATKSILENQLFIVKSNLHDLSKIQLIEGRRQMAISKKAIDTVELFTHLEIYVLIFLAIVIQILIIYKPKSEKEE